MTRRARLVLTCEHGGSDVPAEFAAAFQSPLARQYLRSHRGWDPGSLEAARYLAEQLGAPLFQSTVSRLVVDLNRSLDHPEVFSRFTRVLPEPSHESIMRQHYHHYRDRVTKHFQTMIRQGWTVVHVSVHTFTPVFRGQRRRIDIGLLFDPHRAGERGLCRKWKRQLNRQRPNLRVAMNQPYLGVDDGLTTALRGKLCAADYVGVELEINSQFVRRNQQGRQRLFQQITDSIDRVMAKT